ncbi:MAG TPA: murein L,D-transpeptidase catalytic domain family protein [Flavobacteriaceae bacterium]|nr:murein L,D-transpeptidase catalytic domain family protein [Flavobacteriaceae bacterium]
MKKKIVLLSVLFTAFVCLSANPYKAEKYKEPKILISHESDHSLKSFALSEENEEPEIPLEEKINKLYRKFETLNTSMPSRVSFQYAMRGYYDLEEKGKLKNKILTIVDFSLASTEKRMWVLDMNDYSVLFNTVVAHGRGTGGNFAKNFSNVANSHKSSLGFYLTAETYIGKHGLSLRMDGLEKDINDNARSRYIVIHGADYATPGFAKRIGRLGRSYGCPSVPPKFSKKIINTIKEKSVFFIYYPSQKYLETSTFLNTKTA